MRRIKARWIVAMMLCSAAFAQMTVTTNGSTFTGNLTYGEPGQGTASLGENFYCPPATGIDKTDQTNPLWGTSDGIANLPTHCMNTAMTSTPFGTHLDSSPANTFTPSTNAFLNNVINSANGGTPVQLSGATGGALHLSCGDTIVVNAGSTYTGPFTFPAMGCDGAHWTIVRTSGTPDPNFPAEGVRANPCIAGIANDATHGRGLPGYPDYPCPSFGSTLSAKLVTATLNTPAVLFQALADHYRFIGLEITKGSNVRLGAALINTGPSPTTMGANHFICDRCIIHGEPWTVANIKTTETQAGVKANNSQWVALINGWNFDTYCIAGCVDSQGFSAGTGLFLDGPFKLYNEVMASAGETWILGGGGQGAAGTPVTKDVDIRGNYVLKPLVWMVPIDSCGGLDNVVPKNLGEFKNGSYVLIEGNYFANSWQGCQSDQSGYALLVNPSNQNNHQGMSVTFDGTTAVVNAVAPDSFTHNNGTPGDGSYCPVGGCVLAITDSNRLDNNTDYHFCNGTNGCDQSGMNQTTQARIVEAPPAAGTAAVDACVPGDCPTCRVQHITYRYNEIHNVTNGFQINSGTSSKCHDEAAGLDHVMFRDNWMHGLSKEMSNGSDPYSQSVGFLVSSGTQSPIGFVELSHNGVFVSSEGNMAGGLGDPTVGGAGGLGQQVDHTDLKYLQGINIHDNTAQAPWSISHTQGSLLTTGVGGAPGLANTYQTDSCKAYYPVQAPGGIVVPSQHSVFTFSPSLSSYFVTLNGQYRAINGGFTTTGFTLTAAASDGDTITVRDLNTCNWTFRGNLLGTGLIGSASDMSPYPSTNANSCGSSGTAACILATTDYTNLFANFNDGRTGDFSFTGSNSAAYLNSASDAASRAATGKNPGVDLTVLSALTTGIGGSVFYPSLSITSTSLAANLDLPYPGSMQASAGASPYKGWWLETDTSKCGGSCGTLAPGVVIGRSGTINGPFLLLTVGLTSNVAKMTLKQTIVAPVSPAIGWTTGQKVQLAGFCGASSPAWSSATTYAKDAMVIYSGIAYSSLAASNTNHQPDTSPTWWVLVCPGAQANDGAFNGIWSVAASGASCTNSSSIVCLVLTHADISSHAPHENSTDNQVATFAPTTAGTYTWWMGARDGAFQTARAQITLVVNSVLGILAPARATDWTQAGIPGGIPSATWSNCVTAACNTAFSSATTANVNAACATAPSNTIVRIPAGTFSWAAGVHCNHGNVALRGAGPRSTFITGTILMGAQGTSGQGSYPTGLGSSNLSGTLTQGATVLSVASTTGLSAGQTVVIDQHNAAYVNTTGVEGPCTSGNSCGRNDSPLQFNGASSRAQQEMVLITNVNSGASQITIAAPGLGHDYTLGLAPQVFFWNTPINPQYAGVENMNVNANNIDRAVSLPFCDYCWVKNLEIDNTARAGVFFFWGYRDEVRDSYITGSNGTGASTHYGVELLETTLAKGENNILFGVVSPWITEGSYGTVVAYNYMLRTAVDNQYASIETHLSHSWKQLREGNSASTSQYDDSWGSASHMTDFRNYMNGKEPNATNYRSAVSIQALNEYDNLVGNVLGDPTYHTNYQCTNTNVLGSDNYIYDLGFFNGCVNGSLTSYDTLTLTSLMRWGNWDAVTYIANGNTNGKRFCTGSGVGNPACTASETASADPTFPGLASPITTFPPTFYTGAAAHASCGTGLSFWKNPSTGVCPAYPPIGPDVACTVNCVSNTATHAAKIPAQLCYENGAKDGSGYLTAFDAATCYSPDF